MSATPLTLANLRHHAFLALLADDALRAWLAAAYPQRPLTVLEGIDPRSDLAWKAGPGLSVCDGKPAELQDDAAQQVVYQVDVDCYLNDGRSEPAGSPPVTPALIYVWQTHMTPFAQQVAQSCRTAFLATNAPISQHRIYPEIRAAWPVVIYTVTLRWEVPLLVGPPLTLLD